MDVSENSKADESETKADFDKEFKEPAAFKLPAKIQPKIDTDKSVPEKPTKDVSVGSEKIHKDSTDSDVKTSVPIKSPAEKLKPAPPLPYKEPSWSGLCTLDYSLEVIKNGVPVNNIKLSTKPFWVVGRLPQCDMPMEHPSLSRYHAIIQYCNLPSENLQVGWYIYDLGSTHGTTVNKKRITAHEYTRLRVGHTFKFGGSSRLHIMQGPNEDQENELTPEDLTALREKRKAQLEEKLQQRAQAKLAEDGGGGTADGGGCSWGMGDDAEEVDPLAPNPYSAEAALGEELHLDDPKKTLRGWYEREGYEEPEYIIEDGGHGRYKCIVELPVDTPTGHPLRAEVSVQGKKKEAVIQCALEACRLLDRQGVLRQAKHESRKRKVRNWDDNDYYDSDDDTFLDRTGDIEKKREIRMKRAGKLESDNKQHAVLTYDQLVEQLEKIEAEMLEIQNKLDRTKALEKSRSDDMDDLDAYMMSIKSGGMNATEKTKCKRRMIELRLDKARTEKLINIAKPNSLEKLRKTPKLILTKQLKPPTPTVPPQEKMVITGTKEELPDSNTDKDSSNIEMPPEQKTIGTGMGAPPTIKEGNKSDSQISPKQEKNITDSEKAAEKKTVSDSVELEFVPPKTTKDSSSKKSKKHKKEHKQPAGHVTSSSRAPASNVSSLANMVSDLKQKAETEQLENDPDFAGWLPPKDQSGDGRTSLNDKLGY